MAARTRLDLRRAAESGTMSRAGLCGVKFDRIAFARSRYDYCETEKQVGDGVSSPHSRAVCLPGQLDPAR
jgi:hypothetical protein